MGFPRTPSRRRPAAGFSAILILAAGLPAAATDFVHPRALDLDYCVTRDVLASYDPRAGDYTYVEVDGTCVSRVGEIDVGVLGVVETFIDPGNCQDGKQNILESGVDCGGVCDAQCVDCIDPWTTTYWPVAVPGATPEQIGPRLLQLADDQLLVRAYDALFEFADEEERPVAELDTSDEIFAAIAWYVDDHMTWRADGSGGTNETCINVANGLGYSPGWDFPIPASYTVNYTGLPACDNCPADFCGDCEDHAILRQALAKRIGISSKCVWNALDLNLPGAHEYNVVLYRSKYRLMDYGEIDRWLATHDWSAHETESNWNYIHGPRKPDPGGSNRAEDFTYNYPLSGLLATPDKVDCPVPWTFHTYYEDTCP